MSLDPLQYLSSLCGRTNQTLTDDEALDWERKVFSRFKPEHVLAALSTHADRSQFRPQISDVLKLLGDTSNRSAHEALNQLVRLVNQYGPYRSPEIKDEALSLTIVELGGWPQVCQSLPDPGANEIGFDRFAKRFAFVYAASSNRVHVLGIRAPSKPMGLIEAQSSKGAQAAIEYDPQAHQSDYEAPKVRA